MDKYRYCLIVLVAISAILPVSADIINVPGDQSTIQAGINAAVDGDTVLVEPGVYYENINFRGKGVVLGSRYILERDPVYIETTIIDGSNPADPDTASCVLIISGEDSTTVLEGFTLTKGTGTVWLDEHGAGVYTEGGGILIQAAAPTIKYNIFLNNEASRRPPGVTSAGGGAIRCGDGNPSILNNIFYGNEGRYGGGIVLNFSGAVIKNNVIAHNTGGQDFGGSGIWILSNGPAPRIIENNTIVENSSSLYGGGILVWGTSITLTNNIIWGNTAPLGPQIHLRQGGAVTVRYSDVEGGWNGEGNIDLLPSFMENYLLTSNSPCIDAGDTSAAYNDPEDPNQPGQARWPSQGGLRSDIGAYGGPGSALLGVIPTTLEPAELPLTPDGFLLKQNYPNPFNPSTNLEFRIWDFGFVKLEIFDITGQKTATLISKELHPGEYAIQWDGRDDNGQAVAGGMYFYRLQVTGGKTSFQQTRKMLLLK
jgi:hypothetical protein